MAGPASTSRQKDWGGMSTFNTAINQKLALSAAYAELGKELSSTKLKTVGSYTIGKIIGEGTYGKVRMGIHRLTGTRVAIKQIPKAHSACLTREIHHHRRLHHPNVMQLYEVMATESHIWMVTELCPGGELYDYLVESGVMPEVEARRIFGQLCLAVAYVHDRGIVHRDLKLENVLLDERCNVKLGDFGFTREFEGKKLMETFCGTTGYAAPEMLAGRKYTGEEVDIWSLGVILYALLCGALPFDDDNEFIMKEKILKGEFELPDCISQDSRDLVAQILQLEPSARPSIKNILKHNWFKKIMLPRTMVTVTEHVAPQNTGEVREGDPPLDTVHHPTRPSDTFTGGSSQEVKSDGQVPLLAPEPTNLAHQASLSTFSDYSFHTTKSKSDSESSDRRSSQTETTSPTTEDDGEMQDTVPGDTLPSFNVSENNAPLSLHRNESQSTIKRAGSSGSEGSKKATAGAMTSTSKAANTPLPTHHEHTTTSEEGMRDFNAIQMPQSTALEKGGSQGSSRTGHFRTPSRTKRRSSGGHLAEHFPPTLEFKPIDFIALLEQSSPAIFSTVREQNILHQLSRLGMDVGQIVHSVINEACDASGAMWWILNKKAQENQNVEEDVEQSPFKASIPLNNTNGASIPFNEIPPSVRSSSIESHDHLPLKPPTRPVPVHAATSPLRLASDDTGALVRPSGKRLPSAKNVLTAKEDKWKLLSDKPMKLDDRKRASSFSVRLSNVLSGKSNSDSNSKKDSADNIPTSESQASLAERSKSPVETLLHRMTGGNSTPTSPSKLEKKEQSKSVYRNSAVKQIQTEEMDATAGSHSSSRSSPMRSVEDILGHLKNATSIDTFSTITSSGGNNKNDDSPGKSKAKPSFLSTVRTWFEDKDKVATTRKKKQNNKQENYHHSKQKLKGISTSHLDHPSHLGSHNVSRNGSFRQMSGSGAYPPVSRNSSTRRSPHHTLNHRGSLSRRSSSGSGHYYPPPPPHHGQHSRSLGLRRPSAGSITPTATLNNDELLYSPHYSHASRSSRPSSAQSQRQGIYNGTNTLHGKSGSASSTNSIFRHHQQQQQQHSHQLHHQGSSQSRGGSSGRGHHSARRSSLDGGTTVVRHKRHPSPHQNSNKHHVAMSRSDSRHSRPATPSRLGQYSNGEDAIIHDGDFTTPRRSIDSERKHGRASPLSTPRASQSVFVAHKNRTPYKPPSSNPALHRHDRNQSVDDDDDYHDGGYERSKPRLGAWRQSWGQPPPGWTGPVDSAPSSSKVSTLTLQDKPRLRDVFANRALDDDWEDEDDFPTYAGGLGQLDSCPVPNASSGNSNNDSIFGQWTPRNQDGMPNHVFGANRYAGVRSLFQPPSLGKETMPKAWVTTDGVEAPVSLLPGADSKLDTSTSANAKDVTTSRVRSAAPAFKGADILEEDEEEEEE